MAIEIKETFQVDAPVERVWRFLMDPYKVAACMPGASLDEVSGEGSFLGSIKVKVGAVSSSYKGQVSFTEVDETARRMQLVGEGREAGGGTAKAVMVATVRAVDGGGSEVVAEATVDLTGRIMQVGRGMIQGVSHQLFLQFVKHAKQQLAAEPDAVGSGEGHVVTTPDAGAIKVLPLLFQTFWSAIVRAFRTLLGRRQD